MAAAVANLNAIYERDLAVNFIVVGNENIIFTDAATDPYDTSLINGYDHFVPNRHVMDDYVGEENYDVGIVFGPFVGGGGAATGAVCRNHTDYQPSGSGKADAFTPQSLDDPTFAALAFPHEIGHISGAPHAFTTIDNGASFNPSGVEPSAGYSIMSYGHFLSGQRPPGEAVGLQFHALSTQQINTYLRSGTGSTCGSATDTGNDVPVVSVASSALTIPAGTPFFLEGSATDGSATPLTYSWEQMDQYGNGSGPVPLFRSFDPQPTGTRYFPDPLVDYFDETLPTGSETYTFRLTARDNASGGGGVGAADVQVTTDATVGPFVVTFAQTPGQKLLFGTPQTVTWDVAGTDAGAAGSPTVNVLFSDDGGETYAYTLASGVPNSGSASVTFPVRTSLGRVKVEAAENVFYNTSETFEVLTYPVAGVSPSSISQALLPGQTTTTSVSIANTAAAGALDLDWTARVANAQGPSGGTLAGACTEGQSIAQEAHDSRPGDMTPKSGPTGGHQYGQSFSPDCDGVLRSVSVENHEGAFGGQPWEGVLRVYAGEGNGGALLRESSVSGINPTSSAFMTLPLAVPLAVEASETYTFLLEITSGATRLWFHDSATNGDVYPDGVMQEVGPGNPASNPVWYGDLAFRLSFGEPENFLLLFPYSGSVAPEASDALELTLDASGYPAGTYTADLVFTTNDPDNPEITVLVTMSVTSAAPAAS